MTIIGGVELKNFFFLFLQLETFRKSLTIVESSNAAIVCCTTENLLLIYHKFKVKTIRTPRHESIKAMAVLGGKYCGSDDSIKTGILDSKIIIVEKLTLRMFQMKPLKSLYVLRQISCSFGSRTSTNT